ncbi:hypothetical protein RM572_25590 [Streptomyces sp. DSM 42041]|uniref:Thiaminase-2/PQQC domain-containing protein n=1 Tax=Streptomyces hazeniae TaxID=3075538 RepID=A0ABU2NYS0_9ACTN|nr:hypothetical protein [Streptomyces sp. DSM 42041]MDT0382139.1 hypothetical protein [Streptomyces sp. DSM 42041]
MNQDTTALIHSARQRMAEQPTDNRFLDLLEAGQVSKEHLCRLAGELYHLVRSDGRSFDLLASRFSQDPAGDLFSVMAEGELEALSLLLNFAEALNMNEEQLAAYEPEPLAHAYPAYLAQTAAFGTRSDMVLALLANVEESGQHYARAAAALESRYGFDEKAIEHFHFFADTPQDLLDQAVATLQAGLADGDEPAAAVRTAWMVNAYENCFWQTLAAPLATVTD